MMKATIEKIDQQNMDALVGKLSGVNTEALVMLWEGNQDEGLSKLSTCFSLARALLAQRSSAGPASRLRSGYPSEVPIEGVINSIASTACEDNYFRMYRNSFTLEDSNSLPHLCAVLSYNMAIIAHEFGMAKGSVLQLYRARELYTEAANLLPRLSCPLLELAISSNLGHLCSFLNDGNGVEACRLGLEECLKSGRFRLQSEAAAFFISSLKRALTYQTRLAAAA
jgi:hypothetical protein